MEQQLDSSAKSNISCKAEISCQADSCYGRAVFIFVFGILLVLTPVLYALIAGGIILGDTSEGTADQAIRFYLLTSQASLDLPEITLSEISHMYDVKKIVWNASIVLLVIVVIFVLIGATFPCWFCKGILFGSILALGLLLLLAIFSFTAFNTFFTGFHQLFFSQGNWQFPSESLLIQTYPEQFWKGVVLQWIVLFAGQALVGVLLAQTFLCKFFKIVKSH
ncbi:MAG: DUF1461 domain-containing protein [Candidatus Woesearchaeota archaeon]|nr:DUF1461 domain-containing protein [Candidatus Woesearchaeota archaeon]